MVDRLALPESFDVRFPGFARDAFEVLGRLRANPVVDQYRKEKDEIARVVKAPFRQFREDLVVNVILPNHLSLETERNVFSRLLKNDFGAGGCNSHVWMSFYRSELGRLNDLQTFHGIDPDGFFSGLHVGGRDRELVARAKEAIRRQPEELLKAVNALLQLGGWSFDYSRRSGGKIEEIEIQEPMAAWPEEVHRAQSLSIYRSFDRQQVIALGPALVQEAAVAMQGVWPLYRAFVSDNP